MGTFRNIFATVAMVLFLGLAVAPSDALAFYDCQDSIDFLKRHSDMKFDDSGPVNPDYSQCFDHPFLRNDGMFPPLDDMYGKELQEADTYSFHILSR